MLVDGQTIGGGYALDYTELARSTRKPGEYGLFTCGCGEPGCAGIFERVVVKHTRSTISWQVVQPPPEFHFTFDAAQYRRAVREGLEYAQRIITNKRSSFPIKPWGFDAEGLDRCISMVREACEGVSSKAKRGSWEKFDRVMAKVRDVPPLPGDEK